MRSIRDDGAMHQLAEADLIWQQCLFAFEEPSIDSDFSTVTRTWLDDRSWVDYAPRWLHGADRVFAELIALLPWHQREVTMYDRRLPEPRLTAWWTTGSPDSEVLPVLAEARAAFTRHYVNASSSRTQRWSSSAPGSHARSTFAHVVAARRGRGRSVTAICS